MKQQIKVKLIRHGEKRLFMPDPSLTELGRAEVKKLAEKLVAEKKASEPAGPKIAQILLTSPKRRTQETAAIIGQALQLPVVVDDFLNLNYFLSDNTLGQQAWRQHFSDQVIQLASQADLVEILAITHSQNIRHYWQLLKQTPSIYNIMECGVWEIAI